MDYLRLPIGLFFPDNNFNIEVLLARLAFLVTFLKIGNRVFKFMFLFFDYKLKMKVSCEKCGAVSVNINFPKSVN